MTVPTRYTERRIEACDTIVGGGRGVRQLVRVVKEVDLKSTGLRPRRFESCSCRLIVCEWVGYVVLESVLLDIV